MGNAKYEINFEHDDNRYRGVAQLSQTRCSIELESMPGLEFRFPINHPQGTHTEGGVG
jgi:hypothetical protein